MNELQVFNSDEFGTIRTVTINDETCFIAKDIAEILGYSNTRKAIIDHVDDEDKRYGVTIRDSMGRSQSVVVVNESGLYSLVLSSKQENAKKFKKWVTSEVLPSIRKHGIYATDNVIDEILNNPDFGIKLLSELKEERNKRIEAERRNAILTHVNKTYTMTEIAKELNMKSAIELNKALKDKHVQYKVNDTWVFYSLYSSRGYEEIKQEVLDSGKVVYHRKITQLGREFILNLFQ